VKLVMQLDDDLPEPVAHTSERHSALTLKEGIQLENISFSWPDGGKLFDGFSAAIRAHTITGIVGQSGRGKTTLIDLIAGLQKPDGGKILIDGKPLDEDLLPGWKAGLGYLPQDPFFIDGTLRENLVWDSVGQGDQERGKGGTVTRDGSGGVKVSESSGVTDEEIMSVLEQVNATHLITRFRKGLDAFVVNYHTTFSGGECQRLALARVLLRRPTVLLLDEATSSLDAENETVIMEVLEQLREKVTIVFVTHRDSVSGWFDSTINI